MTGGGQTIPDWGKDWYAGIALSGSVRAEVCSLYGEWLHLVRKPAAGFFTGQIPRMAEISPEGISGARAIPSTTMRDTSRWRELFGQGFVPIGCP